MVADAVPEIQWIEPDASADGSPPRGTIVTTGGAGWTPPSPERVDVRWRGRLRVAYRRWHQLGLGAPSPRLDSTVRRVLRCDLDVARDRVQGWLNTVSGLDPDGPLRPLRDDPLFVTSAVLVIPWSWPALPVDVAVERWWRDQSLVTVRLRSTRRWRYPVRYFAAVHGLLDQVSAAPNPPPPPPARRRPQPVDWPPSGSSPGGWARHQPARKPAAAL